MNVLILYFSGTGNTKFIAERIGAELRERGHPTESRSVERFDPGEMDSYDFLVFGYPVYGYDMPDFLKGYVKRASLPKTRGVFLYSTLGYNGGNALRRAAELFEDNGFLVVGSTEFSMPGNDGLILMEKTSRAAREVLATDYGDLEEFNQAIREIGERIEELKEGGIREENVVLPERKLIYLLVTPLMKVLFRLLKRIFVKRFRADEDCINCGICEEICPANNISLEEGEVHFGNDCYLCLRCVNQCPVEAIQITRYTEGKFRFKGPTGDYLPAPLEEE